MGDILFRTEDMVFSCRVAGLLVRDGKILLQKPPNDDFAYIGGHIEAFETAEAALKREFREELGAEIAVGPLAAVGELFFPWGKRRCHQIGLYFWIDVIAPGNIPCEGFYHGCDAFEDRKLPLDYGWVPLTAMEAGTKVYPLELTPFLLSGGKGVFHFVSDEN